MEKRGMPTGHACHQAIVAVLTFASYMQITALRKTQSYVKSTMVAVWVPMNETGDGDSRSLFATTGEAEKFLGALDSVFMFTYAMGSYFLGAITDRCDPRIVLSVCMSVAAILTVLFGYLTEVLHFYSIPFYVCIWIVNGVCQSAGWPSSIKLMDNWFGKQKRGLIFGLWSSGSGVGSIAGAYICALILPFGYEYAFLVNASLLLAIAIVVFFGIVTSPKDLYGPMTDTCSATQVKRDSESTVSEAMVPERPKAISFLKALLLPGVIAYALTYAFLKGVSYSIFFWLPYYMGANFGWSPSTAATLSTCYDWGGILGSTVCGFASDLLGKRSPILVFMLVSSVFSLGGYAASPDDKIINGFLMLIVGFFVSGATNLVSSAVTADLGCQMAVLGNTEALSTVSGIIEGSGSMGAAIGQALLPVIADAFGWNSIFYGFMIMLFGAMVMLSKLCYREMRETVQDFQTRILALTSGIGESTKSPDIFVISFGDGEKSVEG